MADGEVHDPAHIATGLSTIRKRRWFLWVVIIIYLPAMWVTLQFTHSVRGTAPAFAVWFIFLVVAAALSAAARCPRCGNYFHMHGLTLLYLRRCLHCGLHVTADRKR